MMELNGPEAVAKQGVRHADPQVSLHSILAALPQGTMLPAGWLLERISGQGGVAASTHADTLSAQEFGEQRVPRRTADWVREKCAEGWFEGAYKEGGEWRIPRAALTQQVPRSRSAQQISTINKDARPARRGGVPSYPSW